MKVVYVADDGTQFDDEYECLNYEWRAAHPHLKDVRVYDECGKLLEDLFSEDNYGSSDVVIIDSEEGALDFCDLACLCGFCNYYENITGAGKWSWDYEKCRFVKEN